MEADGFSSAHHRREEERDSDCRVESRSQRKSTNEKKKSKTEGGKKMRRRSVKKRKERNKKSFRSKALLFPRPSTLGNAATCARQLVSSSITNTGIPFSFLVGPLVASWPGENNNLYINNISSQSPAKANDSGRLRRGAASGKLYGKVSKNSL